MSAETNISLQNNEDDDTVDIRHYFFLIWHWTWLILVVALLAGGAVFFISRWMTPEYETTTSLLVVGASSNSSIFNDVYTSQQLTSTYAEMLNSKTILQAVITKLGLPIREEDLAKKIKTTPISNTQLLSITVAGNDPALIAKIANTLVQIFIDQIQSIQSSRYGNTKQSLQTQLNQVEKVLADIKAKTLTVTDPIEKQNLDSEALQYQQIYANLLTNYEQARMAEVQNSANVVQTDVAQAPLKPVRPNVILNTAIAAIMGILLALGAVFIKDSLDDTIQTPRQVSKALGLAVLGVIMTHRNEPEPISQDEPRAPVSEAFRALRTSIQFANIDEPLRTLMVTSPSPQEGKTLVSANLAVVLAQGGKKVALVDVDLRRPEVHKRLKLSNSFGVTSLLLKPEIMLKGMLQKTKTEGLVAVTSGDLPPNPAELLGTRKMQMLLDKLKEEVDIIVLDTPPVLPVADAAVLVPRADGVLLVLRPGTTTISAAREAVERLHRVNANIIGVVLNNVNIKSSVYQYYRQNYGHYKSKYYAGEEI